MGCRFEFDTDRDVHAIVLVEPHSAEAGRVAAMSFEISPWTSSAVYLDHFGNSCRRVNLKAGPVVLTFDAVIEAADVADLTDPFAVELAAPDLPDEALRYLLPSRYCESDLIADVAFARFGGIDPGWSRVQAVCDWVHGELRFQYGSSSPSLSAMDVLASGVGVCRDFSHLAIATCRALSIPARYVFGYLPDIGVPDPGTPMDFCAWMEVFLGGRWHVFDPRNNQRRVGRVVIGRGRDAADVAMITSFGSVQLNAMSVRAEERIKRSS